MAGNIGLYCSGFFTGYLTDTRGPRPALILGALALFWGYYPLYLGTDPFTLSEKTCADNFTAYKHGQGFLSFTSLCFFSWVTGLGGSAANSAAIKAGMYRVPCLVDIAILIGLQRPATSPKKAALLPPSHLPLSVSVLFSFRAWPQYSTMAKPNLFF